MGGSGCLGGLFQEVFDAAVALHPASAINVVRISPFISRPNIAAALSRANDCPNQNATFARTSVPPLDSASRGTSGFGPLNAARLVLVSSRQASDRKI